MAPNARPIDPDASALACSTDGTISQVGTIENGKLLQAKGIRYAFEKDRIQLDDALTPGPSVRAGQCIGPIR